MNFFKCLIILICSTTVVARTKRYSLYNQHLCLTRTKLTIFIDLYQGDILYIREQIIDYCRYLKIAFRRNPCLTATLYDQILKIFIEVNEENLVSTLDSVLVPTVAYSMLKVKPLFIDRYTIEDFVVETKPKCLGSNHTTKQTVLYISNFFTNTYEPLRELSGIGGNCAVLMVAFFWHLEGRSNNAIPNFDHHFYLFDWLPFHRLISYTTDMQPFKIKELLPSNIELFKLINNPDFNRFEYCEKTLVSDFQFSDSLRNNATKRLFVLIRWSDFHMFLDLDPILQFLNILKKKVEGMSFQYSVILPEWRFSKSDTVKKIIVDNLRIPMDTKWSNLAFWLHTGRFSRALALTITRGESNKLHLPPDKEVNVRFNDSCQGDSNASYFDSYFGELRNYQHICNTEFLREDNVRAILQSIDSYFVREERKIKGIPGNE